MQAKLRINLLLIRRSQVYRFDLMLLYEFINNFFFNCYIFFQSGMLRNALHPRDTILLGEESFIYDTDHADIEEQVRGNCTCRFFYSAIKKITKCMKLCMDMKEAREECLNRPNSAYHFEQKV